MTSMPMPMPMPVVKGKVIAEIGRNTNSMSGP